MFSYLTTDGWYPSEYRLLSNKQAQRTISQITKRKFGWLVERDDQGSIIQLVYTNNKNEAVRQNLMYASGYPEKWYGLTKRKDGKWTKGVLAH